MSLCLLYKWWQATNEVVTRVPESTQDEMEAAVASCKRAFDDWSQTTILTRQQLMFKLQNLVRENLVTAISVILGNIELSLKFLNSLEIVLHVPVIMFHHGYLNVFKNTSQSFIKPLNNSKSVYRVYCLVMVIKKKSCRSPVWFKLLLCSNFYM